MPQIASELDGLAHSAAGDQLNSAGLECPSLGLGQELTIRFGLDLDMSKGGLASPIGAVGCPCIVKRRWAENEFTRVMVWIWLLSAKESEVILGTIGYVAPKYEQTWQANTRGDVHSYGVLIMELATGRRVVDGGEECLVEWAKCVMMTGNMTAKGSPFTLSGTKPGYGAEEMTELLKVGVKCTADQPQARPNMKEVLSMLVKILGKASSSMACLHLHKFT
ncbi:hypothetical protein Bca52824_014838 [Brassica carinata]|uniref:Protein kinase domain-containing protein n=1 Tax=Brassica carinata TaxID=52824 RepID=A0A8X8B3T7_BRACI|nr:hypothetical protein Bca52824_014838 [Brassica carinata]